MSLGRLFGWGLCVFFDRGRLVPGVMVGFDGVWKTSRGRVSEAMRKNPGGKY